MKKIKYILDLPELKFNDSIRINLQHRLLLLKKQMVKEYFKEINKFYLWNMSYIVGDSENIIQKWVNLVIDKIGKRWAKIFSQASEPLAKKTTKQIKKYNDIRIHKIKKNNPFLLTGTEDLQQTTKVLQSIIFEQVSLIKSIPTQFHEQILGDVMRSVGVGGDLKSLTESLKKRSTLTSKRIELIARDQIAKATVLIDRQQMIDSGLTHAVWKKSIAGKTHRIDHAEANEKEFDLRKGCLISGEYILPRMKINCKCSYKVIIKKG